MDDLSHAEIERLLSGGGTYRSTAVVSATRSSEATSWTTARGDALRAAPGDMIVVDESSGDRWTVDADVFATTYTCVGGDRYRKTALVRAAQVASPFLVSTLEGTATGAAGDWLAQNTTGECWPIADAVFRTRYALT